MDASIFLFLFFKIDVIWGRQDEFYKFDVVGLQYTKILAAFSPNKPTIIITIYRKLGKRSMRFIIFWNKTCSHKIFDFTLNVSYIFKIEVTHEELLTRRFRIVIFFKFC